MDVIKVPMKVQIWAGDVLVAEQVSPELFGAVFHAIFGKPCALCYQVPREHCCLQKQKALTPSGKDGGVALE